MALSRRSGRVEKLSPELLRPMTLSVLISLEHSPDVSYPGAWPEVDQLLSYSAPGMGSASGILPHVVQKGSLPSLLRITRDRQRERLRGHRYNHHPCQSHLVSA